MKKTLLITFLIFGAGCGEAALVNPIGSVCAAVVEGKASSEERSTVDVAENCTGVYVAPGVVLTAAHCGNPAYVIAGGVVRSNINYVPHPGYEPDGLVNDVALMFLDGPLPLDIATLSSPAEGPALVQGYGITENWEREGLREIEVEILGEREGKIVTTEGSCYGDSGGPLYQGGRVVGIVTAGDSRDCTGIGTYTRLDDPAVLGWLKSEAAINFAGGC